jgi:23S rRNA (guanosine2251-2'-O)-methyltransferase
MTKDQSASVNGTVCDVSAGGTESVPFSVVPNLAQAMARAQESGIWVLGTCERAESSIYDVAADRNWMLVVGNEGQGMRRLTRERCDQLVSMPPRGAVGSLNVATAAAACLSVLCSPRGS